MADDGLPLHVEMSLADIARRLGTTKQTVHRIEQQALAKMRRALLEMERINVDVGNATTNLMRPGCTRDPRR